MKEPQISGDETENYAYGYLDRHVINIKHVRNSSDGDPAADLFFFFHLHR